MNVFSIPQGEFSLNRYPNTKDSQLRAWDAADEYLLLHLAEQQSLTANSKLLILNDTFGALTVALAKHTPTCINDSFLSQQAINNNLSENHINADNISLQHNGKSLSGIYDVVILKYQKI